MSSEKKGIEFKISKKFKALQFAVTGFNGGGYLITDRFSGMRYPADLGTLAEAVHNMSEDIRMYLEELLANNGYDKPVIVAVQFIDKVPAFPQIGAFNSAPTMSPLAAMMFQVSSSFGINPSFPINKEGFVKFAKEVANKLPDENEIIDPHMGERSAFDPGFLNAGFPFFPVEQDEEQPKAKFGNASNTRKREGDDGKTILD